MFEAEFISDGYLKDPPFLLMTPSRHFCRKYQIIEVLVAVTLIVTALASWRLEKDLIHSYHVRILLNFYEVLQYVIRLIMLWLHWEAYGIVLWHCLPSFSYSSSSLSSKSSPWSSHRHIITMIVTSSHHHHREAWWMALWQRRPEEAGAMHLDSAPHYQNRMWHREQSQWSIWCDYGTTRLRPKPVKLPISIEAQLHHEQTGHCC